MAYLKHIIVQGETLQSIAQDVLGDMTQWYSIAQLNNLKYPYIADTVSQKNSGANLVTIGDTILINIPDTIAKTDLIASMATLPEYDQEGLLALALGKDLDIMPNTSGYPTPAVGLSNQTLEMKGDGNNHLALVSGLDNLRQSIYIRLITPKGSYLGHPEYGSNLDMYLGMKNTEENAQLIDLEIQRTIWTDSRVTGIIFNGHEITNNVYTASFTISTLSMEQAFEFIVTSMNNGPLVLTNNFGQRIGG